MKTMGSGFVPVVVLTLWSLVHGTSYGDDTLVYSNGDLPNDSRLADPIDLNAYFPFRVAESRGEWQARSEHLKRQVLVATGLWPLPDRTPLNAQVYGRVQREGFTVEKVHFESMPGHFVTGLLFRPSAEKSDSKRPAVLCPHGHGGRMQDYGADKMKDLIAAGAEKFEKSGRFPKLARCAHLARMGCVVFIFDMLGYEDSQQISYQLAHRFAKQRAELASSERWGLFSAQAEMRLQSIMGIQTWNSVRCLDFLESLPDVDPSRIGVTGGSGGGTQTILLCAIDDRPVVGFPNGMVSTAMQGGCTCENCCLLRIGTGNVELAALFAPKPMAMTAANDWTKEMMTKGYPELQQLYSMLDAKDQVFCRPMLHFPHNYNYESRATMYEWFNRYLGLNLTEFDERDYELLSVEDAKVWDSEHPQPPGGDQHEQELLQYMAGSSDQQISALLTPETTDLSRFRKVVGGAFEAIVGRGISPLEAIKRTKVEKLQRNGHILFKDILRLEEKGEELPVVSLYPTASEWSGEVVIWVDGNGKQALYDEDGIARPVADLLNRGASVVAADLFQQGEFRGDEETLVRQRTVANPREAAAYTYCYNDTLFVRRVHDVLTLVSFVANDEHRPDRIVLVGKNGGGPIVALARALCREHVELAVVDTQGFRFVSVEDYRDADFLPGAIKYGDLPAILALNAPEKLVIVGESSVPPLTQQAYAATGARTAVSVEKNVDLVSWPNPNR